MKRVPHTYVTNTYQYITSRYYVICLQLIDVSLPLSEFVIAASIVLNNACQTLEKVIRMTQQPICGLNGTIKMFTVSKCNYCRIARFNEILINNNYLRTESVNNWISYFENLLNEVAVPSFGKQANV